jgi:MFS family permease
MIGRVDALLCAACLGMLALGANGTAIMAALPTMRRDLALNSGDLEWAINAYLVVSAACIIPGGRLSDLVGAHRIAQLGLLLFAAASILIAVALTPATLLFGRAFQGLGAALAVPGTLAAIGTATTNRAAKIGAWAGFLMLGFSIGPLMGGTLTHYLGWRTIFWCTAVAMLAAAGIFLARRDAEPALQTARLGRLDWAGFVLVAVVMTSLVATLQAVPSAREAPARLLIRALIACGAFLLLWRTEPHEQAPVLDWRMLSRPPFWRALAVGSIAMFSILALLLYFNLDAQNPKGFGFSAVKAGLFLLPLSAGLLLFAFLGPVLIRRAGPRTVLTAAMAVIVVASAGLAACAAARALIPLGVGLFAMGAGLALPYATAPRMALAALPAEQAGQGSGIINACTFLGGSVGVACGAIVFGFGGLPAVLGMIAVAALAGAWICRGLATEPRT